MPQPNKKKIPLAVRMVPKVFRVAEFIAPRLAKRWGAKLFITPLKYRFPEREYKILQQAEVSTFKYNNNSVQVYSWGTGPVVFFMHGWAGRGMQVSEFVKPLLEAGFKVVTFDAPAHGKSPGKQSNILEFSEAMRELGKTLGPVEAVIGHSIGGAAVYHALLHGFQANRVITVSTPAVPEGIISEFLRRIGGSPAVGEYIVDSLEAKAGISFASVSALEMAKDLPETLPVLIVHDTEDEDAPLYHADALSARLTRAERYTSNGLGHTRILRDEAVIQRILDFTLEEVPVQ